MTGGVEENFEMGQGATGRGFERSWVKRPERAGSGSLEREGVEGLVKARKLQLGVVAVEGISPPSPLDSMAASSLNRDLGLGGGGGDGT